MDLNLLAALMVPATNIPCQRSASICTFFPLVRMGCFNDLLLVISQVFGGCSWFCGLSFGCYLMWSFGAKNTRSVGDYMQLSTTRVNNVLLRKICWARVASMTSFSLWTKIPEHTDLIQRRVTQLRTHPNMLISTINHQPS